LNDAFAHQCSPDGLAIELLQSNRAPNLRHERCGKFGLHDAAAKLLGGASAKDAMLAERAAPGGGRPTRPATNKPWFRKPRRG
jgi:hypothetical protein